MFHVYLLTTWTLLWIYAYLVLNNVSNVNSIRPQIKLFVHNASSEIITVLHLSNASLAYLIVFCAQAHQTAKDVLWVIPLYPQQQLVVNAQQIAYPVLLHQLVLLQPAANVLITISLMYHLISAQAVVQIVANALMPLFAVNAIMGFILIMDHATLVIQIVCFAVLLIIVLNA